MDAGFDLAFSNELRIDHSITCPLIIGTGHLSLELGGPRQFGPHGPDPEFDRKAVEWIASGDIASALAEVSLESLWLPGNVTLTWWSATGTTRAAQSNGGSQSGPTSS